MEWLLQQRVAISVDDCRNLWNYAYCFAPNCSGPLKFSFSAQLTSVHIAFFHSMLLFVSLSLSFSVFLFQLRALRSVIYLVVSIRT